MKRIHIYADGSCMNIDGAARAGWGIVIVQGDDGLGRGRGTIIEETHGVVQTDPESEAWDGALLASNNTAELTALLEALRWTMQYEGVEEVMIRCDSMYAMEIAEERWKAKANLELVDVVRAALSAARVGRNVDLNHVRGHEGHRWNERADHLARSAAEGKKPKGLSFW